MALCCGLSHSAVVDCPRRLLRFSGRGDGDLRSGCIPAAGAPAPRCSTSPAMTMWPAKGVSPCRAVFENRCRAGPADCRGPNGVGAAAEPERLTSSRSSGATTWSASSSGSFRRTAPSVGARGQTCSRDRPRRLRSCPGPPRAAARRRGCCREPGRPHLPGSGSRSFRLAQLSRVKGQGPSRTPRRAPRTLGRSASIPDRVQGRPRTPHG